MSTDKNMFYAEEEARNRPYPKRILSTFRTGRSCTHG